VSADDALEQRLLYGLDRLLHALELESLGADHFGVVAEPGRFDRMFGGQMLAQALVAAAATVEGTAPKSLHAYFVEGGAPGEPVEMTVERVRDGRSMSTRRTTIAQGARTLLTAISSFHANPEGPEVDGWPAPEVPGPDELPLLQDWVVDPRDSFWVEYPPPIDIRMGESLSFLGEPS
jgi:acyl-CoA thioesterase-2